MSILQKFNGYFRVRNMHSGYFIYEDDAVIDERTRVADFTNEDIRRYNVVVNQLENKKFQPKTMNVLYTVSFAVERYMNLYINLFNQYILIEIIKKKKKTIIKL